jgi:hypothetical protein
MVTDVIVANAKTQQPAASWELVKALDQKMQQLWLGGAKPAKGFYDDVNTTLQVILDQPVP